MKKQSDKDDDRKALCTFQRHMPNWWPPKQSGGARQRHIFVDIPRGSIAGSCLGGTLLCGPAPA